MTNSDRFIRRRDQRGHPYFVMALVHGVRITGYSDQRQLVVCAAHSTIRMWDLRLVREGLAKLNLDWDLPPYQPGEATPCPPLRIEVVTQ